MDDTIDRKRLQTFINSVTQEILNMKAGESKFRTGAMHLEKNTCPALNRFNLFKENPTRKNLSEFLLLTKQDWGGRCADAFKSWSDAIFAPEEQEKNVVVVRPFEVQIKDCFYDCFKTVSIPMTPKQIEVLEKHAFKLANVFRAEISKGIGEQLEVLVKRLKEKESNV